MNTESYDIVVVGGGPAGQKAAIQGRKAGKRVLLVEKHRDVGGACVRLGTIPSKTLHDTARRLQQLRQHVGVQAELQNDLPIATLLDHKKRVLGSHVRFMRDQLERNGVELVHGQARFRGSHQLEVVEALGEIRVLNAEAIVIATGSLPRAPSGIPVDHTNILDSDSILSMIYLPRSLTVVGGGVIASEYASTFQALGVAVTMIDRAARPLFFLDSVLTDAFVRDFEESGGRYLPEREIRSVSWDGASSVQTTLESGRVIESDKMLVALGRVANLQSLDIERAGLQVTKRGYLEVNEHCQTSVSSIYAVGDVIGPPALASHSMEQGRRAVCHALGLSPGREAEVTPTGIYTIPEIASVGMSEQQAREQCGDITIGFADFEEVARGLISGGGNGFLRLIAKTESRELLGVQIVGESATDLIHVGQMALLNRASTDCFVENIFNFPTYAEAYRIAALKIFGAATAPRQSQPPVQVDAV